MYSESINKLCKAMDINSEDICPVYIPCDGSDGTKISLLQTEANGSRINSYMFACQQYKCGETKMKELRLKAVMEMMPIPVTQSKTSDTEVCQNCIVKILY
jgi:hypothetical protein